MNFITLGMPKISDAFEKDGEGMLEMTMSTLSNYVVSNCCFGGEQSALPFEVSRRVFEIVVFDGVGDQSLENLIYLALMTNHDEVCCMDF